MATTSTRQYNLRSQGQDMIQLPVELHLAEDATFIKDLLASQRNTQSGQVSDNDSSINDSDCEALIASSGDEHDSNVEKHSTETVLTNSDPTNSDAHSTSQQAINMQILAQLQSLGSRLDAMEKKSCKKSTDMSKMKNKSTKPKVKTQTAVAPPPVHQPSIHSSLINMRQDENLQVQVEKRLQELASLNKVGTKLKSLRGGGGL